MNKNIYLTLILFASPILAKDDHASALKDLTNLIEPESNCKNIQIIDVRTRSPRLNNLFEVKDQFSKVLTNGLSCLIDKGGRARQMAHSLLAKVVHAKSNFGRYEPIRISCNPPPNRITGLRGQASQEGDCGHPRLWFNKHLGISSFETNVSRNEISANTIFHEALHLTGSMHDFHNPHEQELVYACAGCCVPSFGQTSEETDKYCKLCQGDRFSSNERVNYALFHANMAARLRSMNNMDQAVATQFKSVVFYPSSSNWNNLYQRLNMLPSNKVNPALGFMADYFKKFSSSENNKNELPTNFNYPFQLDPSTFFKFDADRKFFHSFKREIGAVIAGRTLQAMIMANCSPMRDDIGVSSPLTPEQKSIQLTLNWFDSKKNSIDCSKAMTESSIFSIKALAALEGKMTTQNLSPLFNALKLDCFRNLKTTTLRNRCYDKGYVISQFKNNVSDFIHTQKSTVISFVNRINRMKSLGIKSYADFVKQDPEFLNACRRRYHQKILANSDLLRQSHRNYFEASGQGCNVSDAMESITDDYLIDNYCKETMAYRADPILKLTTF